MAVIYRRLIGFMQRHEKERARRLYYEEILPDARFSRGEITRLGYRLGVIDEGDRYLAEGVD